MNTKLLIRNVLVITFLIAGQTIYTQNLVGNIITSEEYDGTGEAVAISDTRDRIIVGSDLTTVNGKEKAGVTRVYELSSSGIWQQIGQDISGTFKDDELGHSVCISADGNRIAIGTSRGARVYDLVGNEWEQVGSLLKFSNGSNNNKVYELRLSNDGNTILISGSNANMNIVAFELLGNDWVKKGNTVSEDAREDIALSADGNRVAVIATNSNSNIIWEIRVFEFHNGDWELLGNKINPPSGFWFTEGFDMSSDGNRLVAALEDPNGSSDGGLASYDLINGQWLINDSQVYLEVFTRWGTSLRASADANTIVFGSSYDYSVIDETKVFVYRYIDDKWQLLGSAISGAAHDETTQGHVEISADGTRIIMGGIQDGFGDPNGFAKVYDYSNLVGVDDPIRKNDLSLYPNPSSHLVNISLSEHIKSGHIQLLNITGQLLYELEITDKELSFILPEPPGIYLVKLVTPNGINSIYKVIKK